MQAYLGMNPQHLAIGACALVLVVALVWPKKKVKYNRPTCPLTPLEIRAFDVVEALDELDQAIAKMAEEKRALPSDISQCWAKASTASKYLRRFLEEGR